jgi:hypothetical protein
MKATLTVTSDFTKQFNEAISRFKKDSVLIGIPASETERDDDEIGNAAILALNHFGSEEAHIPPRPVLTIGIRNAQDKIAEQFKLCAQSVLKKGPQALTTYYERAGIIASNACKKVINDQDGIKPPSDATLRARKYLTKSGFTGKKALVVTGQMRNAITYVVQSIWGRS